MIAPEDYSFKEQLALLTSCTSFASTIGSCTHNSIFLQDGAEVVLIPRADYFMDYQETVNDLWPQDIYYVDSHLSVLANFVRPWSGPFCYHISRQLRDFFSAPNRNPLRSLIETVTNLASYFWRNRKAWKNLGRRTIRLIWKLYMRLPDRAKAPYRAVKKLFKH